MDIIAAPIDKREKLNWPTIAVFAAFHAGAAAAPFFFTWKALIFAVGLYWISLSLGIGMGYHRLLTHRSYRVPKWIEYFLTVCATLALEGGPIFWVATHRVHHQFSDREGDPHTPRDGKWWAHMLWMMFGEVTHCDASLAAKYAPDLARDRFHVWISKYHYLSLIALATLLWFAGGLPCVLWGIFLRVTFGLHATWMVNSLTHLWGSRRFTTRDDSRNNWFVALLSFGEGWHNNHHAHPTSARHGLAWYEIDMTWMAIKLLEKFGLARSVKTAGLRPEPERKAA